MADVQAHVFGRKVSKAAAHYYDAAPEQYKAEPCSECRFFEQLEPRHCSKVVGVILPEGHCGLWKGKA